MSNISAPGISVIICCYNSASRIGITLKHIALQKARPNILWEVVVVDNNSIDDTQGVARQEWMQYNIPVSFKIVSEPKPGLIYARQKGVTAAIYDLLLFCDDDNWLAEDYIANAFEIMATHKNVAVLGGCSEGYFETGCPY